MADKLDFKKEYKDLYQPPKKPVLVEVPPIRFLAVDGRGEPTGAEYQAALSALYAVTFTVKMSKQGPWQPEGYFDYVLPPLEGFWWSEGRALDFSEPKSAWLWSSVLRAPDYLTEEVFRWALEECARKKPEVDTSRLRLEVLEEGLCVQMLHVGSYDSETESLQKMLDLVEEKGLKNAVGVERRHHEIYLSDPRKTPPEKRRTVLRLPVERG